MILPMAPADPLDELLFDVAEETKNPVCLVMEIQLDDCIGADVEYDVILGSDTCEVQITRLHAHAYGPSVWYSEVGYSGPGDSNEYPMESVAHHGNLQTGPADPIQLEVGQKIRMWAWVNNGEHPEYSSYEGAEANEEYICDPSAEGHIRIPITP